MPHTTRSSSWLSKLFGHGPRTPIRRVQPTRLRCEHLEDRVVPVTQVDYGGLRFVGSNDFLHDANGDYYAGEGTVSIGYTPAAAEAFRPLIQAKVDSSSTSSFFQMYNVSNPTQFNPSWATLELLPGGTPGVPIRFYEPGSGTPPIKIANLIGTGGEALDQKWAFPIQVAGVDVNATLLQFTNPDGGDTSDAQAKLQGKATFENIPLLSGLGLEADINGTNYLISDSSGINLTGASITKTFTLDGLNVAGTIAVGYDRPTSTFTMGGGVTVTSTPEPGGKAALNNVGANVLFSIDDGVLSEFEFNVTGSFTLFETLTVSTLSNNPLFFQYKLPTESDPTKYFQIGGGLQLQFNSQTIAADFGTEAAPGIIISNGKLQSLNATFSEDLSIAGVTLKTDPAPNGLTLTYQSAVPATSEKPAIPDRFVIYGDLTLGVAGQTIEATLGTKEEPGFTIVDGTLTEMNVGLAASINAFGLKLDIGTTDDPAMVRWVPADHSFNLTGTYSADFKVFQTRLVLGGSATTSGSDNAKGLSIVNGHFSVPPGGKVVFDLQDAVLGPVELKDLELSYTSDAHGGMELDVKAALSLPGGWSAGGEFDLIEEADGTVKLHTISIDVSPAPGAMPIGETGLSVVDLDVKVTNIDTPSQIVVTGDVAVVWGEQIPMLGQQVYLFRAEGDVLADAEEFVLDCTALFGAYSSDGGTTWQGVLGKGEAKLTLDWADNYYALHAELDGLAGIFDVEGDFVFESGREIAILAEADVVIPAEVPFIGGDKIGGVGFFFQHVFAHDTTPTSTTVAAWITLDIFTTFTVGFEYVVGPTDNEFKLIGGDQVAQFEQDVAPPVDQKYTYTSTFTRGTGAGQIPPGATSAVFGVDWSKPAVGVGMNGQPTFQVVKIVNGDAGDPIAEADFAANGISFITDSNFNTPTSKAIRVVGSTTDDYAPLAADYKLLVTFDTVGGNPFPSYPSTTAADVLLVQATSHVPVPSFGPTGATGPVSPTVPAGSPTVAFPVTVSGNMDEGFYSQAQVTLYQVRQADPFRRGVPVSKLPVTPITPAANGVNWTATFTVPIEGLYSEEYVYYAVVNDGTNPPIQSAVSAPVTPAFAIQGKVANQNGDPEAGWTVFLDLGGDGNLDASDPVTITNAGGFYSFAPTFPNSVNTQVVVRLGVQGPQNYAPVTMPIVEYNGSTAAVANFALQEKSAIKGTVFIDRNNDGVKDGDAGAAGAVVYLDLDGNGQRDQTDPMAVADTNGSYTFGGMAAGTYAVAVDVSSLGGSGPAWQQTSPTPRARAVTVAPGGFSLQEGNDFGVLPPAVVSGTVTGHDFVNGQLAADATPQPGVTVNLLADQLTVAVDAGGGNVGNFYSDANPIPGVSAFGGTARTTGATIDTSRVLRPAPQAVYQSARDGEGNSGDSSLAYYFYNLQPGRYTVRLHFADFIAGAPGERQFNVEINDSPVLTNYDIIAAAGGSNTALVEEFTVETNDAQQIIIAFSAGSAGVPIVNGIEILQPGSVAATTTTDANGKYSFTTHVPGRYVVQVAPAAGWRQVAPYHSDLQFAAGTPIPAAARGGIAKAADFDGDGFLDLATDQNQDTGSPATIWVGYNGRDGSFGPPEILTIPGLTYLSQFAVADLNRDGRPDLALLNNGQQNGSPFTLDAYLNTGSAAPGQRFQFVPNYWTLQTAMQGNFVADMATANLNGDGLADVLLSVGDSHNIKPASVVVLLNAAQPGDRSATVYQLPTNADTSFEYSAGGLAVADLNADGHLDVVANSGQITLTFPNQFNSAFGDGTGRLGGWTSYNLPVARLTGSAAAADLNGDRAADAAVIDFRASTTNQISGATVYLGVNRGNGILDVNLQRPFADTATGTTPPARKVVLQDVDGDLRPDLVVLLSSAVEEAGTGGADRVLVYLNSGAAPYFDSANPITVPIPGGGTTFTAIDMLVADFTNDGLNDLLVIGDQGGFLIVNTSPPGQPGVALGVVPGGTLAGNDLVIAQDPPAGTVYGDVHEDLNRNGQRDAGEQGRAGTFVFADLNRNGRYDTGEPATATIAHGAYTLSGLTSGAYSVGVVSEDGWRPTEFAEVTVGAESARADFGRVQHLLGEVAPQTVRARHQLDVTVPQTAAATGDGLVFSLEGAVPAGMTINAATGRLTWTPTAAHTGTHTVTVRIRDPLSPLFTDTRSVTIEVSAAAVTPSIAVGGAGRVRMFSTDGSPIRTLVPFGTRYRGPVRVATGDVNGDGVEDVIATPGPGGRTVVVFDGTTGEKIASAQPFNGALPGGLFVAAGDVNGDGLADLIVAAGAGGNPRVRVLSGKDQSVLANFLAFSSSFRGGVRVAAGDVNGDGKADVIVGTGQGAGRVAVFDGATNEKLVNFKAYGSHYTGGLFVTAGDVDGDGRAEVITGKQAGSPRVRMFDGAGIANGTPGAPIADFVAGPAGNRRGARVAFKPAHADNPAALIVGCGDRGRVRAYELPEGSDKSPDTLFDLDILNASSGVFVG